MNKVVTSSIIAYCLIVGAVPAVQSAEKLVEVRLVDDIDETRGYCLDIAGGRGTDAPVDQGLQAHTCYDYTGGLLEDQSFDAALIDQGQFKIPYFNVCMSVSSIEADSAIMLAPCESVDTQKFSLKPNGHLIVQASPELCVTASSTEKKEGRGGTPIHVMRPLSLQPCSDDNKTYQVWSIYTVDGLKQ